MKLVMSSIEEHLHFLRLLATTPTLKQRQVLLRTSTRQQIFAIAEIVLNVLKGKVSVSPDTLRTLKAYRKTLRKLATEGKRSITWLKRREAAVKSAKAISILMKDLSILFGCDF